jgi:ferredoxin--NADP+ reductase
MHLEDFDTETRYQATLLESHRITAAESSEEVRELVLDIAANDFSFTVGQNVGVLIPGPHAFGNELHFRLYTIADIPAYGNNGHPQIKLCVRRCFYIDDYSGEKFPGVSSNYLCDLQPGQMVTLTGPYGQPFAMPDNNNADILMIGMGTGIAPFRAFVKHIYDTLGGWQGKVRLFYGAHTGLELLYMNDQRNDFANYYDEKTFKAFEALSPRPHWDEPAALDEALQQHQNEVWDMLNKNDTCVYIAGHESMLGLLDKAFSQMAGSEKNWQRKKAELEAGRRWTTLLYEA